MRELNRTNAYRAIQDFRSARQKAVLREVIARIRGVSTELLSFDEVRQKLRAQIGTKKALKEIPIAAIIGSVNRYQDFTRDFLPGRNVDEERWANIEMANQGMEGLPPIEAYQMGEVYFVSDGNHRVSVAKQLGTSEIQAYVTEVRSRVPLSADIQPEELILKFEYAEFVEKTNLDKTRPEADLSVTVPGQYETLEEHIAVHRYYMGLEQQHDIAPFEAAADWYDKVYLPVVSVIRERGLLIDFPNRSEADLYLWIAEHRAALEESLQSEVAVSRAAEDLAHQYSQRTKRVISRIGHKIAKAILPEALPSAPLPAAEQGPFSSADGEEHLFGEILVPINGQKDGWYGLEQAVVIAQREKTDIHGLYILENTVEMSTCETKDVQDEFASRCNAAEVSFDFYLKTGDITQNICEAARTKDLVVINLSYPPEPSALVRLSSGIRDLILRCPRPILFTPQISTPLDHALLVYDGSLQSRQALYAATYLAGRWNIPLHVISVGDESGLPGIHAEASRYLESHAIEAEYISSTQNLYIDEIQQTVTDYGTDLLIIGGYSHNPLIELVQGSEVDSILRQSQIPVIVCR